MEEDETDVILICGSHRYPCHRNILSQHSPYFQAMFTSPMLESTSKEITLKDVTPSALKTLIDFAYTHKFQATTRTVHPVLEAACMFHFETIEKLCIDFLLSNLTIKNCLSIMCCADRLGISQLLRSSRQMVLWEFTTVVFGKEFLQLEAPGVQMYLSNDGLRLKSEIQVFDAINKWIEHEPEVRNKCRIKLLETIRFGQVSQTELGDMLREERVRNDAECAQLLMSIRKLMRGGRNRKSGDLLDDLLVARRLLEAPNRVLPMVPAVIGRGSEEDDRPVVMYLEVGKREVVCLCDLNKVMSNGHVATGFRSCIVGQRIYLMGGEFYLGCSNWNESMWSLDTFCNSWHFETKLPTKRRHQCVCVLDQHIYLIGGIGQFRVVLDKVERYDTTD
uniref:BTB domain-containing protein n=1 Tax=Strigamia maritima TaxID=126957 RepID=T1IJW7_STRMM